MTKTCLLFIPVCLITVLIASCTNHKSDLEIVYVRNAALLDSFQMTTDLNIKAQKVVEEYELLSDSLDVAIEKLEIDLYRQNIPEDQKNLTYEREFQKYIADKEVLENRLKDLQLENKQLIINRLNEYITSFAKENSYSLIIGANGEGNVLYGDEKLDITYELIGYCNAKYLGK